MKALTETERARLVRESQAVAERWRWRLRCGTGIGELRPALPPMEAMGEAMGWLALMVELYE